MSLRTKLLAAVVGVPVAIQLISLLLLSRFEDQVDTSIGAIGRITSLARVASWREFGRAVLTEVDAGNFDEAFVMRYEKEDREYPDPDDYWTLRFFLSPETRTFTKADIHTDEPKYTDYTDDSEDGEDPDALESAELDAGRKVHSTPIDLERSAFIREYAAALTPLRPLEIVNGVMAIRPDAKARGRPFGVVFRIVDRRRVGRQIYLVMVLGALATGLIGWWLLSRLVTDPLGRLAQTADAIAAGRPVAPTPPRLRPDEFGRTFEAMQRMGAEISEYQSQLEDRVLSALKRMKKAEQHLTIAQRLAATGTLTAGLAHEINNPLGGMKNAVQALERGDLSHEQTALYLELVSDGLARIEQMVKKFVTFTPRKIEAKPVDLVEVVDKCLALTAHKLSARGIQLIRRFPPGGVAIVYGDRNELQQVALNLILNAADALGEADQPRITVEIRGREEEWGLIVHDNGTGIPEADQDRIYDMFFTTKAVDEGSGMGLAVVHTIVTNHGGRVELESSPAAGTTFLVSLPHHARPAEDPSP